AHPVGPGAAVRSGRNGVALRAGEGQPSGHGNALCDGSQRAVRRIVRRLFADLNATLSQADARSLAGIKAGCRLGGTSNFFVTNVSKGSGRFTVIVLRTFVPAPHGAETAD